VTYRVSIKNPVEGRYALLYVGEDIDEAVEVYEESRCDTLFGIDICHVELADGDGNQLARTDAGWFGKINPY
jgi:hypothetical protein